jgi:hypothetical protein
MKPYLFLLSSFTLLASSGCVGTNSVSAQSPVPVVSAPVPAAPTELEQLVAPIALYPDALVALILPASTASSDVVLAARFLNASHDPNQVDEQPWDESVKGLAHYPDVVKWMDENLSWTQRLGEAYLSSPDQVMAAVQTARARAREKGLLTDTPQQQVVMEDTAIRIVPANPEVIYVPRYDPEIIYMDRPVYYASDPWITFGIGFGVGSWLAYDCDWGRRTIWVDHHRWDNRHNRDWRRPHFPGRSDYVSRDHGWHQWHPSPDRPRPIHRRFNQPDRSFSGAAGPRAGDWGNRERNPGSIGQPQRDRSRDHERGNRSADDRRENRAGIRPQHVAPVQANAAATPVAPVAQPNTNSPSVPSQRGRFHRPEPTQPGATDPARSARPDRQRSVRPQPDSGSGAGSAAVGSSPAAAPAVSVPRPVMRSQGEGRRFSQPGQTASSAAQPVHVAAPPAAPVAAAQSAPVAPRQAPMRAERSDGGDGGGRQNSGRAQRGRDQER